MTEHHTCSIQTIHSTGSDHLTEDAFFAAVFEHHAVMLVADGAPLRLRPVPSMQPLLDRFMQRYGAGITPSGIASRLTRDTVAQCLTQNPEYPLGDAIIQANQALAQALANVYGDISAESFLRHEPDFTILAEDARYCRLMLPACTYTAVRVNFLKQTFEIAHGADSAVLVFWADGCIEQITPDQMRPHDDAYKQLWFETGDEPAEHPFFRSLGDSRARERNRKNGLYHNYVDETGQPDATVGVSIVNGLPQISDYMFQTERSLTDVQALLVTSDGMFWPTIPNESPEASQSRLNEMRQRIQHDGLSGYITALRAEEDRLAAEGIPHGHDDATAILIQFTL